MVCNVGGASTNGSECGGNGALVIMELPLDKIRKPFIWTKVIDPHKVKELMDSLDRN